MLETNQVGQSRRYTYSFVWRFIGLIMLIIVLVLFLIPVSPSIETFSYEDKIYHALVFAFLCVWYLQLYPRPILIAVAFILFGLLVEWLQSFTSYRTADIWDFAADSLGVGIGFILYRTVAGTLVQQLDTRLDRIVKSLGTKAG